MNVYGEQVGATLRFVARWRDHFKPEATPSPGGAGAARRFRPILQRAYMGSTQRGRSCSLSTPRARGQSSPRQAECREDHRARGAERRRKGEEQSRLGRHVIAHTGTIPLSVEEVLFLSTRGGLIDVRLRVNVRRRHLDSFFEPQHGAYAVLALTPLSAAMSAFST